MDIDDLMKLIGKAKESGAQVEIVDHRPGETQRLAQMLNQPMAGRRPPAEVQLMELKQVLEDIKTLKFKVGDIVTPKKSSILRGSGHPFIVVEVDETPERHCIASTETSAPDFGARFNIRVAGYSDDGEHILCWWNESFHYDFWNPPTNGNA